MWLHTAVQETFRELFTLSDPNRTGDARTKNKAKSVVKKYLQIQAGVPGKRKTETVVRYAPTAQKPPLRAPSEPPVTTLPPASRKLPGVTPKLRKAAAKEAKKLGNNAKEPFIEDPSTWNEVIHDPQQKTRHDTLGTRPS